MLQLLKTFTGTDVNDDIKTLSAQYAQVIFDESKSAYATLIQVFI
jgi:hypothetical protein